MALPVNAHRRALPLLPIVVGVALVVGTIFVPLPALATEAAMRVDTEAPPVTAAAAPTSKAAGEVPARVDITPFKMIGVSWTGAADEARIRVRGPGGWGPWEPLEADEDDGPDAGSPEDRVGRAVTRPVWVGQADGYQLEAAGSDLRVHLVREASSRITLRSGMAKAGASAPQPPIATRTTWGARTPRAPAAIAPRLKMAFVHHTVGSNTYRSEEVPGVLRGVQAYHMDVNGWDDIGYNFLVDRFGRVWEGRAGGIDRAVIGAQSAGFNTGSTGVAVMGTFTSTAPPAATIDAVSRLLAWKLGVHGVDPDETTTMTSGGNAKYRAGAVVTFNTIAGHRDAQATACPGYYLYERLPDIRQRARALTPVQSQWYLRNANTTGVGDVAGFRYGSNGDLLLTCDWNGDGSSSPGIQRGASFSLRNSNTTGTGDVNFIFGSPGDIGVCGDWNGDGRKTIGVLRGGTWYLNNQNDSSPPEYAFVYGDPGDRPVVGDWNGDGVDTVGVRRGHLWYLNEQNNSSAPEHRFGYGDPGDRPVVGKWSAGSSGPDSIGVFRAGAWYLNATKDSSPPEYRFWYGDAGDTPVTGDWDRNGSSTPGVVRG